MQSKAAGSDIYGTMRLGIYTWKTDPVLLKYKDDIKDFGYLSDEVQDL